MNRLTAHQREAESDGRTGAEKAYNFKIYNFVLRIVVEEEDGEKVFRAFYADSAGVYHLISEQYEGKYSVENVLDFESDLETNANIISDTIDRIEKKHGKRGARGRRA